MNDRVQPPHPPLGDGTITLRVAHEGDLAALDAGGRDPETQRWLNVPVPATKETARAALELFRTSWERAPYEGLAFVIADAVTNEFLGAITLFLSPRQPIGEVGYGVAASSRGRGIATRAVELVSRWAFDELGVVRMELRAHPENLPSQRVAEKAGFTREGVERGARELRGERHDVVCYSLLPGELG